jgi:hypothetical protein
MLLPDYDVPLAVLIRRLSACLDGLRAELAALKALRTTNPAGSC